MNVKGRENMKQTYQKMKTFQSQDYEAKVLIDHYNERCRIDDYRGNVERLVSDVLTCLDGFKITKLIVKARKKDIPVLLQHFFRIESIIDNYFNGDDMYFMCRYLDDSRKQTDKEIDQDEMIASIYAKQKVNRTKNNEPSITFRKADMNDAKELSRLYQHTFSVYPTPLFDPAYIVKTMKNGTIYYIAAHNRQIISAASAEINRTYFNAEITDCATEPSFRKHKLMNNIIRLLEEELRNERIFCAYSIARAESFGMNAVLHQLNYQYRGRLVNNCYIGKSIENMNVWCKNLSI